VAALLARDLQLTLRGFSSAVYVALGLAAAFTLALVALLASGILPPDHRSGLDVSWLPELMAAKTTCVLSVTALSTLTPLLVAYQIPALWLERSVGCSGLELIQAKLWYSRLVSLPAVPAAWLVAVFSQSVPGFYVLPLLAECMMLWWLVSSLIGSLSFETPARAGTAIITAVATGSAAGIMSAWLWPFGLLMYLLSIGGLTDRARQRARYFLITGED
jgi:hypothetical protein